MPPDELPEVVAFLRLYGPGADGAFERLFGVGPEMGWKQGEPKAPQYRRAEEEDGASLEVRIHTEAIEDAIDALFARLRCDATQAGELAERSNLRIHVGAAVYGGERAPSMVLTRKHIALLYALRAEWLDIDMYSPWRDETK
jgi:hypothetical protein